MHFGGVGEVDRYIKIIKRYFVDLGVKWNQTFFLFFFTNTVLIIDNVSCLEQVFSLLSLRTKTAKLSRIENSVEPRCY